LKLTNGKFDFYPVCSPDLKWVYYLEGISSTLSRVPLDGLGKAERIFDVPPNYYFAGGLTISPDGKTLVAAPIHKTPTMVTDIALFELGSHGPPRVITADIYSGDFADLQSTHDGNSVAYVKRQDGVDNLWVNRLDGSAAYPITDFKSDQIWGFSFSLDGKNLAVLRGHWESDVVFLQETKP
jgi:Tol biopolymer transport system component